MTSPIESAHRMSFTPSQNRSENSSQAPPLHQEWMDHIPAIEDIADKDLKNNTIPIARIKKIMKALDGVSKHMLVSSEVPLLFSKACEMLILHITGCAWNSTESNKRRTIHLEDIINVMGEGDVFSFLTENLGPNPTGEPNNSVSDSFNHIANPSSDNSILSNPFMLSHANNLFETGQLNDLKNYREPNPSDYNDLIILNQQPPHFFLNSQLNMNTLPAHHLQTNRRENPNAMDYPQNHYSYQPSNAYTLPNLVNSTPNKSISTTNNSNPFPSVQMSNMEHLNSFASNPYSQKNTPSSYPEMSNNISFTPHHPTQWTSYNHSTQPNRNTDFMTDDVGYSFTQRSLLNNNNLRNPNYNFNNIHSSNNVHSTQGVIYPNNLQQRHFLQHMQPQPMINKAHGNNSSSSQDLRYPTPINLPPTHHSYNITYSPKIGGNGSIQSSETESAGENYTRKSKKHSKNDMIDLHFKQNSNRYTEENF